MTDRAQPVQSPRIMRTAARNFGLLVAAFLLVLLAGFWIPYLTTVPHFDPGITPAVHLHAAALFSWALLMLVQPLAIVYRAPGLHRVLGTASFVLMALIVLTSVPMLHKEYLERLQAGTPAEQALRDEYLSGAQLLLLSAAYVLSVRAARRRDIKNHWSWMLVVVLVLLPAGLSRTLGYWFEVRQVSSQSLCAAINLIVLTALGIRDLRRQGRSPVFAPALVGYGGMVAGWLALGRPV